jgi:hypothetical protein
MEKWKIFSLQMKKIIVNADWLLNTIQKPLIRGQKLHLKGLDGVPGNAMSQQGNKNGCVFLIHHAANTK